MSGYSVTGNGQSCWPAYRRWPLVGSPDNVQQRSDCHQSRAASPCNTDVARWTTVQLRCIQCAVFLEENCTFLHCAVLHWLAVHWKVSIGQDGAYRRPHWFSTKLSPILVIPLNFRQFWWQKKPKSKGIIVTRIGDIFFTQKLTNFFKSLEFSLKLVTKKTQNQKELLSPELVIFLSLKNSPISPIHQKCHQNWWQFLWKFNRKFKSPKCSQKLVKILGKIQ